MKVDKEGGGRENGKLIRPIGKKKWEGGCARILAATSFIVPRKKPGTAPPMGKKNTITEEEQARRIATWDEFGSNIRGQLAHSREKPNHV